MNILSAVCFFCILCMGILQVKSEESGSHFAMDTRTFREALSGQPMEEALAPDNNADRSYNGYRTLNRRIGSINAERNDNITGHTHSNHDGEIDDKKKSDLASILQTSATQSSVHISYDLPNRPETTGPQSFPIASLLGNRRTGAAVRADPSVTPSASRTTWDDTVDDSESRTYFPVLPTPAYEYSSESSQRSRNLVSSSEPAFRQASQNTHQASGNNQNNEASRREEGVANEEQGFGVIGYSPVSGSNSDTATTAPYPAPQALTKRTGVYGSVRKTSNSFTVDHGSAFGVQQQTYTVTSRPRAPIDTVRDVTSSNYDTPDASGIYERVGYDQANNLGEDNYPGGVGAAGGRRTFVVTSPSRSKTNYAAGGQTNYGTGTVTTNTARIAGGLGSRGYTSRGGFANTGRVDYDSGVRNIGLYAYGNPGEDFPIFRSVPNTGFSCSRRLPGYYADIRTGCQAFYICQDDGRMDGFLCPNSTVFSQELLTCDYWINVNCDDTERYYSVNEKLFVEPVRYNGGSVNFNAGNRQQTSYDRNDGYSAGRVGSFNNRSDRRQQIDTGSGYGKGSVSSTPISNRRTDYVVDDFQTIDRRGERRQLINSQIESGTKGVRRGQQRLEYSATSDSAVHEESPEVDVFPNAEEYDEEESAASSNKETAGEEEKAEPDEVSANDK